MTTARRLVLVRHAKAARPSGVDDHDRPLDPRGRRDAPALGRWLADHVGGIDLVLCSSAERTKETWALAAAELPGEPVVEVAQRLYLASTGQVLEAVRGVDPGVGTLAVVGHEPVLSTLTHALAGPGSDPGCRTALAAGFSTSAVAVLETDDPWDALQPHGARLIAFAAPRG